MNQMPKVDLAKIKNTLTEEDFDIAQRVLVADHIRATKPVGNDYNSRCAQYVWRMVVFHVSCKAQHQMFPAATFMYLPENAFTPAGTKLIERLNIIVDAIEYTIPMIKWTGVIRWGKSLGYL